MWSFFQEIARNLPCPDCAADASRVLSSVTRDSISSQEGLRRTFYLLHNYVNRKKKKPLFDFSRLQTQYSAAAATSLTPILQTFFSTYHTHGANPHLLADSMHRTRMLGRFRTWLLQRFLPTIRTVLPPQVDQGEKDQDQGQEDV
jgi:hypothetical protein